MSLSFSGRSITIDGSTTALPWPVLQVAESASAVYVLLDPDSYIADPSYKVSRRAGAPAVRNLLAFSKSGQRLWEAELPEQADYYYKVISVEPLIAYSFSSHRCEIDPNSGAIVRKEFLK